LPFLTPHSLLPAFEDGTDTWFRNVSKLHIDAGEIPKRTYTTFVQVHAWFLYCTPPREREVKTGSKIQIIFSLITVALGKMITWLQIFLQRNSF
jgi:hypothetical protein